MEALLILIFILVWIWSIVKGLSISVACAALNFFFPPISQIIFSIYEEELRLVTFVLIGCMGLMYWVSV